MTNSSESLKWFVTIDGETYSGEEETFVGAASEQRLQTERGPLDNTVRIHCDLPAGKIEKVTAQMKMPMAKAERAFFNGYQTWTHSPEHKKTDKVLGMTRAPKHLIDKEFVNRYGDYHFIDYPAKKGMFHGFSWCYIRNGKIFRFIGSLDERPGYTIFRYDANVGMLSIERDCAGVVHNGGEFAAFDLYFAIGEEDPVFDGWFAEMGCKCRTQEKIKGYSSWYNRYEDITEETVLEDLEGCITVFDKGDLFQIDDGWEPAVGDWLEPDRSKFSMGMDVMAELAHTAGFKAGLWLAPFVAETDSALFREHPDWFLMVDGKPWELGCNWSTFYSLDIDNPEVCDYLRRVFDRVFNEWGFDLVKLDFLYGAAPFGNERESRAARMIRGMELIREWCGDNLVLGCGVPLMPSFGLVDYCRIGCDVALSWSGDWYLRHAHSERVSTINSMDNSVYRRELNGRAFGNDPDVFFLRDNNIKMTRNQLKRLAQCNALLGNVLLTSDDPSSYKPEAKAYFKKLVKMFAGKVNSVRPRGKGTHEWVIDCTFDGADHQVNI